MKAITICQPWAELIARGEKRVENRTRSTSYRGELAIHAGKSRRFLSSPAGKPVPHGGELVFGAVVAVATLVDCVRVEELAEWARAAGPKYRWLPGHEYAEGPWCWVLEDVRRVEPVECGGKQGLWNVAMDECRVEAVR